MTGAPRVAVGKPRPGYEGNVVALRIIRAEIARTTGRQTRSGR